MLSITVIHRCRQCGSERIRKNGHANYGAQRAKCLECARTFHLEPKGPRYDGKFKAQGALGLRGPHEHPEHPTDTIPVSEVVREMISWCNATRILKL